MVSPEFPNDTFSLPDYCSGCALEIQRMLNNVSVLVDLQQRHDSAFNENVKIWLAKKSRDFFNVDYRLKCCILVTVDDLFV